MLPNGWFMKRAAAALILMTTAGCASMNSPENAALGVNDPFESVNRDIHAFNKGFDRYALRPIAQGYDAATPGLFRLFISNALSHLELPRDFANHVLTAEFESAGRTLLRFAINTTVGAGGLLDPATDFEVEKENADFGKTLAVWGAGEGFFYSIPFLGPSTVRHTAGRVVDLAFAPTSYLDEPLVPIGVGALAAVEARADNAGAIDSLLYDSVDSYSAVRSFYLNSRRSFVGDEPVLDLDALDPEASQ